MLTASTLMMCVTVVAHAMLAHKFEHILQAARYIHVFEHVLRAARCKVLSESKHAYPSESAQIQIITAFGFNAMHPASK